MKFAIIIVTFLLRQVAGRVGNNTEDVSFEELPPGLFMPGESLTGFENRTEIGVSDEAIDEEDLEGSADSDNNTRSLIELSLESDKMNYSIADQKLSGRLYNLHRLWNGNWADHFYTTSTSEARNARDRLGFSHEGLLGKCYSTQVAGTKPLHRFFFLGRNKPNHFYTASNAEYENVKRNRGFRYEGIQCYVPVRSTPGAIPVYRSYNPAPDHFYTTSYSEARNAAGWTYEGIGFYLLRPDHCPRECRPGQKFCSGNNAETMKISARLSAAHDVQGGATGTHAKLHVDTNAAGMAPKHAAEIMYTGAQPGTVAASYGNPLPVRLGAPAENVSLAVATSPTRVQGHTRFSSLLQVAVGM